MVRPERLHFQVSHLWHSFLSRAWCVCAMESRGVVGKWAQAEQEAPHRAIPDDYVEGLLTFVLHRLGATDVDGLSWSAERQKVPERRRTGHYVRREVSHDGLLG
jgi:hypothetical protein